MRFYGKMLDNFLEKHSNAPKRNWIIVINSDKTEPDSKEEDESTNIIYAYFWDVLKLYTFTDTEKDDAACEDLESLELVQMLKMVRNCNFLCADGGIASYENVITMRNNIMHSSDNLLEERDLLKYFEYMVDLLSIYPKTLMCQRAVASLEDLQRQDLFKLVQLQDELTKTIGRALKLKRSAIEFDIEMTGDEHRKDEYKRMLSKTCDQIKTLGDFKQGPLQTVAQGPLQTVGKGIDWVFGWR